MPYPPYIKDPLLTAIQSNLPLFLMLGFILYVIQLTKNIVFEKERKLKVSILHFYLLKKKHLRIFTNRVLVYDAFQLHILRKLYLSLNIIMSDISLDCFSAIFSLFQPIYHLSV